MTDSSSSLKTDFSTLGKSAIRPDAIEKVTGKAKYGADIQPSNALVGRLLCSPYAHARILRIDTSKATALPGVKSIVTGRDFPETGFDSVGCYVRDNLAVEKALYHGHPVAAVAAISAEAAEQALAVIEVEYEVLPVILDIDSSLDSSTPALHEEVEGAPSNVCETEEIRKGDIQVGFEEADLVLEQTYSSPMVHQGYIEPPACTADFSTLTPSRIWTSTQGHFLIRAMVTSMLGIDLSQLHVIPTEIGGGFGGKNLPYLEAIALLLSMRAGRPVKMVMTREQVLRTAGPGSAFKGWYKIGAKKDGTLTAFEAKIALDSGAFPGAPLHGAMDTLCTHYRIPHIKIDGSAVLTNKPTVRAYRGPGGPQAIFGTESLMNDLASELGMDPIDIRIKNSVQDGDPYCGGEFKAASLIQCLEAAKSSEHYRSDVTEGAGRAVAAAYWHNGGGPSSAEVHMNGDGTVNVSTGSVDLSGTRLTLAMQVAEELGVPVENVTATVADTESVGYTWVSGGSRTTFITGLAVIDAARDAKEQIIQRAASGWNVSADRIEWNAGIMTNPDTGEEVTMKQVLRKAPYTGGAITGMSSLNVAANVAPCFMVHVCDVEVDQETGQSRVVRYTVVQDAGKAVHPALVEGQLQGGAVQGIGWALNEEMIYDSEGRLENPGFLDYRIPLASDLPMIETIVLEVPNPLHPYGVRGVGEGGVIPPLAAVASAISKVVGSPMTQLPCSPPKVLAAIKNSQT